MEREGLSMRMENITRAIGLIVYRMDTELFSAMKGLSFIKANGKKVKWFPNDSLDQSKFTFKYIQEFGKETIDQIFFKLFHR